MRSISIRKIYSIIALSLILAFIPFSYSIAHSKLYGHKYCNKSGFKCIKVNRGDTWNKLFPNSSTREVVMKLNRMNTELYPGMVIAVPNNLRSTDINDISPFPKTSDIQQPTILVDKSDMAWAAYSDGQLRRWGPISGGKGYCPDTKSKCRTITGHFKIYAERGPNCISYKFPIGKGGAPMPYCMFFKGGYALHGSPVVPGYHASHGCVRLFYDDAKWLNTEFVTIGETRVIIRE